MLGHKFRKQIDLDLLDFNQAFPLVRQQVVDFVAKGQVLVKFGIDSDR
jgi:hypothetical protein